MLRARHCEVVQAGDELPLNAVSVLAGIHIVRVWHGDMWKKAQIDTSRDNVPLPSQNQDLY
jgi:hypothetical protein